VGMAQTLISNTLSGKAVSSDNTPGRVSCG